MIHAALLSTAFKISMGSLIERDFSLALGLGAATLQTRKFFHDIQKFAVSGFVLSRKFYTDFICNKIGTTEICDK